MQLRWGIVGCGSISTDFVQALSALPSDEHKVTCVAASNVDRAADFAKKLQLKDAKVVGSYEQLYADANVDIVYIGTVVEMHKKNVFDALNSGKHVLCEKPLALNAGQIRDIAILARRKRLFFMEAFWSRFFPIYAKLKEELENNAIGDVSVVLVNFGIPFPKEGAKNAKTKYGALLDWGTYTPMFASWVFNDEKPTKIVATGFKRGEEDDTASVTLHYSGDRIAQLCYTGSAQFPNTATVCGMKGTLTIPEKFWCPTKLIKKMVDGQMETLNYDLPKVPELYRGISSTVRAYLTRLPPLAMPLSMEKRNVRNGRWNTLSDTLKYSMKYGNN